MAESRDDLERFVRAQRHAYSSALEEIRAGRKRGHWMWYIFPQLRGLGYSANANYYGIRDLSEARRYLAHPVLGPRLEEISRALLASGVRDAFAVMGHVDGIKLRSSMTLFARADGAPDCAYRRVLEKFYGGREDAETLRLLESREA